METKAETNGEGIAKMDIFLKTRNITDPEVAKIVDAYDQLLSEVPGPLQTVLVRDKIYHEVEGKDGHGYSRTYGGAVPRSSIYIKDNSSSQSTEHPTDPSVVAKLVSEVQQLKSRIEFLESNNGEIRDAFRQAPDASSGPRQFLESVGDDNHDNEDSPEHYEQVGTKVSLLSSCVYKVVLAEGLLVDDAPELELDGTRLPRDYSDVLVKKAKQPNAVLEVPRPNVNTMGEAVGQQIAWRTKMLVMDG